MSHPTNLDNNGKMSNILSISITASRALRKSIATFLLATGLTSCISWQAALAAVYTYTPGNAATDQWSAGTNWNATPVSNTTTELTFVGNNATVLSNGLSNTNTDNIVGPLSLNILDLQGTGSASGAAAINIDSSSSSNYLNFANNGSTTPVVNLNAMAGAAGLTYNVGSNIWLANNTTFQGDGTAAFDFSGVISGGGGLVKQGNATLTISGDNSNPGYGGGTAINAGTLRLSGGNNRLPVATTVTLANTAGATFDLNGQNQAIGVLNGGGSAGGNVTLGGGTLSVAGGSYSGVISGSGNLVMQYGGGLALYGANTYTGSTTINSGTLTLAGGDNCLPTTTAVTLANTYGVGLNLNQNQTIASLSGGGTTGGNVVFKSAAVSALTVGDATNTTFAGVISGGSGSLVKQGSGTLTLSGANTYGGDTTLNAGTLQLSGGSNRLPTTTALTLANVTGASLDLNGQSQTISTLNGGGTLGGNITLGSGTLTLNSGQGSAYGGVISGNGSLAVCGSVTLSGQNTYAGATTINGGTLQLAGGNDRLPTTTAVVFSTGSLKTLDLNGQNQTIASLSGGDGGSTVSIGSATLTVGDATTATFNGQVTETTGSLIKQGTGTLVLNDASTNFGAATINAGTLRMAPSNTAVTLANVAGATLDFSNQIGHISHLNGGGALGGNIARYWRVARWRCN